MIDRSITGKSMILLAVLIVAGFLGNYFSVPLCFGADFLFGSVAVFLVIYFYGLGWGMLAAIVANSYTYVLWGQPYGFINFISEALFVGILLRKGYRNLPALDWAFWLIVGMPLVCIEHGILMHMGAVTTSFIMLKEAINGISNALLANLVICYLPSFGPPPRSYVSKRITFQGSLSNLMLMMVLLPAFLLTMLQIKQQKASLEAEVMTELQTLSGNVLLHLRSWHQLHLHALQALASLAGESSMMPSEDLQRKTEIMRQSFPDLNSMHVEDAGGHTIAFDPKVNVRGESTVGVDVSDRAWFQDVRARQQPVVSEVYMGRTAVFSPIVVISVPVIREKRWLGSSSGTLDLSQIQRILQPYQSNKVAGSLTLTDPQNRVIASTKSELVPLRTWNWRDSGVPEDLDNRMFLLHPDDKDLPSMTRWTRSYYVLETSVGQELPWKLTAEAPVAPLQKVLYFVYIKNLIIMACLTTLGLLLSHIFSRGFTRPLAKLAQVTADLPEKLARAHEIDWPASSAEEFNSLISNFKSMAKALEVNFQTLRMQSEGLEQTNLRLQSEIEDRQYAQKDLKRSISLLHATFESTADGILVVNREGDVINFNQKFADMWRIDPEVLSSRNADQYRRFVLKQLKNPEAFQNRLQDLYAQPEAQSSDNVEFLDGRTFERHSKPQYLGDDIVGRVWSFRDVTQRMQAEEEQKRLEDRLQRAEKMEALGTLAGGVAHDLNNVLGIIVGYSELLLDDLGEPGSARSKAMEIQKGGQRAAAIVQDLLTLARRGVANRKVLNLNNIVLECRNSLEFVQVASYHPNIRIKTDLDAYLLNISGSAVHLEKSLMNLASNAVEAMPEGGIITIRTGNQYLDKPVSGYEDVREGDYVVLSLSDTGEGIPARDLKRIFEPFYTKKVMGRSGTGLGLAVIWGTVKDHLGYINVESQEGKGTTFTLYFPVTREEISEEKLALSAAEYMGKGESILIVDDVREQRELAGTMLEKLQYKVFSVSSGEEAVDYIKEHVVGLVVLDMIMDPGMDGLDTYRKMLEVHPYQRAIIVSGFAETERVNKAQALGAGAYVKKPYVLESLGLAVRRELDRSA